MSSSNGASIEDVLIACLSENAVRAITRPLIVGAVCAWLRQQSVLTIRRPEAFLAQPDTFGWSQKPEFLRYWLTLVVQKFNKFVASEYAYLHVSSTSDTMWLTAKTAALVNTAHITSAFREQLREFSQRIVQNGGTESAILDIFNAIVFVLLFYERPATAVRAVQPVFLSILAEQEDNFTAVPQLLSYFVPHMSMRGVGLAERISLVAAQLALRGFQFLVALTYETSSPVASSSVDSSSRAPPFPAAERRTEELAVTSVREVEQKVAQIKATSTVTFVSIRSRIIRPDGGVSEEEGLSFQKYLSTVVEECRRFYERCQQMTKRQRRNGEAVLQLTPCDVMVIMRGLKSLLRFRAPYSDRFLQLGLWEHILRSEGWVPLGIIDEELMRVHQSALAKLPAAERLTVVETLLRQHDNFQRYQVDCCTIESSPFHRQRCARSIYAHNLDNPPLYRYIICKPECRVRLDDPGAVSAVPLFGWIALPKAPQQVMAAHPSLIMTFDNTPFFVVMPAAALGAFRAYEESVPQDKKYDEKLRKPVLWFAEVYLLALTLDGEVMVKETRKSPTPSVASSGAAENDEIGSVGSVAPHGTEKKVGSAFPGHPAGVTADVGTTVYTRIQDESTAETQRWYVFPKYFVKAPAKTKATVAPAANDSEGAGAAAVSADSDYTVHRHSKKGHSRFPGLPKMFLTGRVVALRELRSTEESRHTFCRQLGNDAVDQLQPAGGSLRAGAGFSASTSLCPYRCTIREFSLPRENESHEAPDTTRGAICEYTIADYHVGANLLSPVVVRKVSRRLDASSRAIDAEAATKAGTSGEERAREDDTEEEAETTSNICLFHRDGLAEYYRRCFPPSRLQYIFRNYVGEMMPEVDEEEIDAANGDDMEGVAVDGHYNDEAAAAEEWKRALEGTGGESGRRSRTWGVPTPTPPPRRSSSAPPPSPSAALANGGVAENEFDVDPFFTALKNFIASEQLSCVLNVKVTSASGVTLTNCRQGLDKLKAFAREKGLQYSIVAKFASREMQAGRNGNQDNSDAVGEPRTAPQVEDTEQYVFRKRVSWSVRDLQHVMADLQLEENAIPASMLIEALTRECEDSTANYELLEFIGDAVMDFLVAADACVLSNLVRACPPMAAVSSACPSPSLPLERWTPALLALKLPWHCWLDVSVPVLSLMETTVTSAVCRNRVIAELLPPTVSSHFSEELYPQLASKVRADVFEAIIGAAYRSGLGLDRIRLLLRRLFSFLPAAVRTAQSAQSEALPELLQALRGCPYLIEDDAYCVERALSYRTTQLFELAPQLAEVRDAKRGSEGPMNPNTHLAASHLPRIQAKAYATFFTTGPVPSYRRLHAFDAVRLHNRILHLFSEHTIGYVNEIITSTTQLVLDLDKVHPRSWGLLSIVWDWYHKEYQCPAGVFALDSSGATTGSGEWKDSSHVHFPQVTASTKTLATLVEHIRAAVVARLTESEIRLRDMLDRQSGEWRVWLHRRTLCSSLKEVGGVPQPHMWTFCDATSLQELSRTSRAVRHSVLEHVAYVTQTLPGLAAFAGVSSPDDIFQGEWRQNADMVVLEHCKTHQRLILPRLWMEASLEGASDGSRVALYKEISFWDDAIDQGIIKSGKLRLYLNDKCDTKFGPERRPLLLDTLFVVPFRELKRRSPPPPEPPSSSTEGFASCGAPARRLGVVGEWLSMWPTKGVQVYHPQRPIPLPLDTMPAVGPHQRRLEAAREEAQHHIRQLQRVAVVDADRRPPTAGPRITSQSETVEPIRWGCQYQCDDDSAGWEIECAHRSTLVLSSLRTSEYRGTDRKVYGSWVNCLPAALQPHGEPTESSAAPCLIAEDGTSDEFALFDDIYEHRVGLPAALECTSWETWLNALLLRTPHKVLKDDFKVFAWSPVWWGYDPQRQRATLYVATEAVLHVLHQSSLTTALAENGGAGMERFAQLFIPQLSYANVPAITRKAAASGSNVFALFPDLAYKPMPEQARRTLPESNAPPVDRAVPHTAPPATPVAPPAQDAVPRVKADVSSKVIVSLASHLRNPTAPGLSTASEAVGVSSVPVPPAPWLLRAVRFVFTETDVCAQLGCLPLVLCESDEVRARLFTALHRSARQPLCRASYILSLEEHEELEDVVRRLTTTSHGVRLAMRHIFLVTALDVEERGPSPSAERSSALEETLRLRMRDFWRILEAAASGGKADSRGGMRIYVSNDDVQALVRSSLSPFLRLF